jgi:antirestriction protein ArdC
MARKQTASARNVRTVTDKLIARFEQGDISDYVAAALIQRKQGHVDIPSTKWSWSNVILMMLAGSHDARGYRQWQAVGRQVKAGTKAFHILAPRTRKVTEEDDNGDESERFVLTGFTTVPVFRVEDTEGDDVVTVDYTPEQLPPLYSVAEAFGIPVKYHPAPDRIGWLGKYQMRETSERIHLVTEDVATFLHELAHAAHGRVLKAKGAKLQGGQDAKQEAVAELSATVLGQVYGYDYTGNCWRYVKSYAKNGDALRLMISVLNDVCEVCQLILDTDAGVPTPPPGTGIGIAATAPYGEPSLPVAPSVATTPTVAATVTMRAGDLPTVATADSYTLQTVEGVVSLVMGHGVSRWEDPMPVRMTGKQFRVLMDLLEASRPDARVCLALDTEECGLMVTIDRWSVRIGAERVGPLTVKPLPGTLLAAGVVHGHSVDDPRQ